MQQILIIEDDRALNQGLCKALKTDNSSIQVCSGLYASATDRQIVSCENLKDAKEQLLCGMPALILLDINLPDGSGLDFLQSVKRDCPDCPVILLTANDTDGDIVNGLELGADDYITKPFSLSVLRARVNTQLRKAAAMGEKEKDNEHVYRKEPYVFDFDRMKFMVDGKEIELSKTEQKLLRILVENAGMNMRRELLLDRVWSDGAEYVDENALSVSVKRLRDKLGAEHAIRTVTAIIIFVNYRRTKKTMDTIEEMLNVAVKGEFTEGQFDETRMSALETKFAHYLSASALSAQNVEAEKDKIKALIADISHQTKTPIANLLLYSELLLEEELPQQIEGNVSAIHEQTQKLKFLIESLVKLSRLENGILQLVPRMEKLQPMLERAVWELKQKAEEKGLQISLHNTDVEAYFDLKWTGEAIGNVIDNAIKYTEHGEISVSAISYEMFVRIDIADTGCGIREEELPKIFRRFYRSELVKDEEGVGIGLYLTREILQEQGGYIKVSSVYGQGSKFSIYLPKNNF